MAVVLMPPNRCYAPGLQLVGGWIPCRAPEDDRIEQKEIYTVEEISMKNDYNGEPIYLPIELQKLFDTKEELLASLS